MGYENALISIRFVLFAVWFYGAKLTLKLHLKGKNWEIYLRDFYQLIIFTRMKLLDNIYSWSLINILISRYSFSLTLHCFNPEINPPRLFESFLRLYFCMNKTFHFLFNHVELCDRCRIMILIHSLLNKTQKPFSLCPLLALVAMETQSVKPEVGRCMNNHHFRNDAHKEAHMLFFF